MTATSFGGLLRAHRLRAGLTQRELADRAGVSAGAIRDLEQGRTRTPKGSSVQAVATALGLSGLDVERFRAAAEVRRARPAGSDGGGPLRIGVLGPVEVWRGGVQVPLGSDLQRTLLARLALGAGTPVARDELVELLWRHDNNQNAVSLLHTHIARLRRLLDTGARTDSVLVGGQNGYRLQVGADHLDVLRFRDLTARAAHDTPETALLRLTEAVALWRGETDVERLASSPLYAAVHAEYGAVVRTFATLARDLGKPEQALRPLRELTSRHELDEPLHAELVLTLAASGRQAEALAAFDRVRSALADQLGMDPGRSLRSAQLAVLRQQEWPARRTTGWTAIQQVPAAPPDFVGRAGELAAIEDALAAPDSSRIVLISGIAGVGKTALALVAAHRLRARYPDGQLYADLRGATAPDPMRVLGRFLRALDVPDRRIGTDEAEAASLFRSELADRRMLVLLDNVRDVDGIRSLLPGPGGSDVIVTSRRRLPGLAAATVVDLQPLGRDESVALVATAAGRRRTDADPRAAGALAEACGRLPLALRIAGARLATRQAWSIGDLVRRLHDNDRLTELSTSDSSVLASFRLGYADLSAAAARAFRLCGLHLGDDFGAASTGALLAMPVSEVERVLEDLLEANMLTQHAADRYRFHDLLGLYARRLMADDTETGAASSRLHTWYADAVTAAMEWVYPRLDTHAERDGLFATETDALAWLDAELPALVTLVVRTAKSADPALAWRIADQLRGYFLSRGQADGWPHRTLQSPAGEPVPAAALAASRGFRLFEERARVPLEAARRRTPSVTAEPLHRHAAGMK